MILRCFGIVEKREEVRNQTLDLFKLLASYMVVFLHIPFVFSWSIGIDAVARFAVPLFFMVSGYFSYQKDAKTILRKAKHIFLMFAVFFSIYFIYDCALYCLVNHKTIGDFISLHFMQNNIVSLVILYNVQIGAHLWFLVALIYCYILYYIFIKVGVPQKVRFFIAFVLLILHLILGELLLVCHVKINIFYVRNFLLFAYPFFMMGIFIRKNEKILSNISSIVLLAFILLGNIEAIASAFCFGKNEIYIGTVVAVFCLFVFIVKKKHLRYGKIINRLCDCSMYIYLLHPMVNGIILCGFNNFGIPLDTSLMRNLYPLEICLITTICALIVDQVKLMISAKLKKKDVTSMKK